MTRTRTRPGDRYADVVSGGLGGVVAKRLGLPRPVRLRRYEAGAPLVDGHVLVSGEGPGADAATALVAAGRISPATEEEPLGAIVVDATGYRAVADLDQARNALTALRRLRPSGRIVVIGSDPTSEPDPTARATAQALSGLVRSVGKELRAGATANLIYLTDPAAHLLGPLTFLLSARSVYVSGQILTAGPAAGPDEVAPEGDLPLAGRVAVVTGAARGIGAATVEVLAREGARVLAVDVPQQGEQLAAVANAVRGTAVQVDITRPDAGARIAQACAPHGGLDVLVHNAGITRDRLLVNLDPSRWAAVLEVNLAAQLRMDETLLAADGPLRAGGRVVSVSSMAGLAGNRGQTNYSASKAGVVGMVQARAAALRERGVTYNAVAPGFIETEMTAKMPFMPRELGRRLNSLSQGGLPADVAEAIVFFARPDSAGVTGQVLRVCGQSLLGA